MQSPSAPFPGYAAPAALPAPAAPMSAPPAPAAPAPVPPPPAGSPSPWPPPPTGAPVQPPAPGQQQPGAGPSPLSDTLEQMLRPQGLFQNRLPPPVDWQQNYPQPPGAVPPGGQFPPGAPYQPGGPFPPPPGSQYPATGAFQQAAAPPAWPQAPTGAMPAAGAPGQPAGPGQPGFPPGGQWPQGGAYQGAYPGGPQAGGPYAGAQFGQEQFPQGQFGPGVQFGPDGTPAGGAGGRGLLGKLPFKRPLIPLAVGGGVVVVVVAVLLLSSQGGTSSNNAGNGTAAGSGGATPTASASTGTTALKQQQAATSLAGLLAQSGTDHSDVNAAVTNVERCKGLAADAKTFNKAAANRRTLLSKLAALPGRPALPAAMIAHLTSGWQASATVDADLAKWATSEAGHCKKNDLKNPAYAASLPFDSKATNGKTEFVKQWNGLARKYGLATYQPSQI